MREEALTVGCELRERDRLGGPQRALERLGVVAAGLAHRCPSALRSGVGGDAGMVDRRWGIVTSQNDAGGWVVKIVDNGSGRDVLMSPLQPGLAREDVDALLAWLRTDAFQTPESSVAFDTFLATHPRGVGTAGLDEADGPGG